ncbi:MAG TPA: hypothetical protein VMA53_16630 [Stellaceae bacterium]|nr:hypothetical protein [Stellaceae bacterium]
MRARMLPVVAASVLFLLACSGSPPVDHTVAERPPPDKGRLYIYRDATTYGSQVWTAVSLNHMKSGDAAPGTVFYRDVAPLDYEIGVHSDRFFPDEFKTVRVAPGSITFVKVQFQPLWDKAGLGRAAETFVIAIVDPDTAKAQMSSLRLVPG